MAVRLRQVRRASPVMGINIKPKNGLVNTGTNVFLASGTFYVPEGVTKVDLFIVAGGGGGGTGSSTNYAGGGGGAGGVVRKIDYPVTPGTDISVVVGAGGTPGQRTTAPGSGGNSSFGSVVGFTGKAVSTVATLVLPT